MKQILQNLRSGETHIADVPTPACGPGMVLIKTRKTLISAGTERMLVEFSKGGLIAKARSQPDKVKQVLDKMKTDGLMPTLDAVFKKLDEPLPLGYCNVGEVIEVGPGVSEFTVGDRVVSNGPHAEYVSVPKNLCAKIPHNVSDEAATFTVLGAIGLQGIRLAQPTLGEKVVVFGAGLIGLVSIQLLLASGCEVMAIDLSDERLKIAEQYGATTYNARAGDPITAATTWTNGVGVDAVIITASAKTDELMHQAAEMCRKRGRIILVGVVGLNLRRADFYEKELSFQVSCSYGPGRYDEAYEQKGQDYPIGYVRWTEQRNFEAILGSLAAERLKVEELITNHVKIDDAAEAYAKISSDASTLGVMLEYEDATEIVRTIPITQNPTPPTKKVVAAMIGAGGFAKMVMAPCLAKTGARLKYVAELGDAPAASYVAKKYGFENATTDGELVWNDSEVNTIFIVNRPAGHAPLICKGLEAGKHIYTEKPLAVNIEQLSQVIETVRKNPEQQVMVGFNRRFSPHIEKMKSLLTGRSEPLAMHMACNAGIIPPDVWLHDPASGGGRIIGEGCHFIDLLSYLADSPIVAVSAAQMGPSVTIQEDKMSIVLTFEDGSIGTVNYFGNGNKSYPKERIDIYSEGRILHMDNFRKLTGYGFSGFKKFKTWSQDKGHKSEFQRFVDRISEGGEPLIPLDRIVNVTLASFAAKTAAQQGRTIHLAEEYCDLLS